MAVFTLDYPFLDGCYCRILLYSSVIPFPSEKNDPSNDSRKSVNARYHGNQVVTRVLVARK